jgi:DNA-directed RNA polymerase specialized sigma24 family protein
MSESAPFGDLVRRLRDGSPGAVEEFLGRYGEQVRVYVHLLCLRHRHARPHLDSEDVRQSVLARFCVGLRLGRFAELDSPDGLRRLLYRMVKNKVLDRLGKYAGEARRVGEEALLTCPAAAPPDSGPIRLEIEEQRDKVRALLSADEWDLVERRRRGQPWEEVGRALGQSPEALRKRYERAVRYALDALGLGGGPDD